MMKTTLEVSIYDFYLCKSMPQNCHDGVCDSTLVRFKFIVILVWMSSVSQNRNRDVFGFVGNSDDSC